MAVFYGTGYLFPGQSSVRSLKAMGVACCKRRTVLGQITKITKNAYLLTLLIVFTVFFCAYTIFTERHLNTRRTAPSKASERIQHELRNSTEGLSKLRYFSPRAYNKTYGGTAQTGNAASYSANSSPWELPVDVCVGSNKAAGEVEDLLCMPRPKYELDLKNPCWWENITYPVGGPQVNAELGLPSRRMRCLPYFHILCCSKSGTTDLYQRISLHPDIVPNSGIFGKEQLFWGWHMFGYRGKWEKGRKKPFTEYVDAFSNIAAHLSSEVVTTEHKSHLVTLDGSPLDMWEVRGWPLLPQNRGLREPAVLTPHLMRHLYRDPKFLVFMRDPVERLYTAYLFHRMGDNPIKFHQAVLEAISMFDNCLSQAPSRRQCYLNGSLTERLSADVHFICYAVYLKEWLAVFPKTNFFFTRSEDYSKNIKSTLLDVFTFLSLPEPDSFTLERMQNLPLAYHTQQKDIAGPMLPETRAILRKYVQPCNAELADLLGDEKYLWNDA